MCVCVCNKSKTQKTHIRLTIVLPVTCVNVTTNTLEYNIDIDITIAIVQFHRQFSYIQWIIQFFLDSVMCCMYRSMQDCGWGGGANWSNWAFRVGYDVFNLASYSHNVSHYQIFQRLPLQFLGLFRLLEMCVLVYRTYKHFSWRLRMLVAMLRYAGAVALAIHCQKNRGELYVFCFW